MKTNRILALILIIATLFSALQTVTVSATEQSDVITVIAGSDFQNPSGNTAGKATITKILSSMAKDGITKADGFLFCGGEDIDPKYYGEEKSRLLGNICSVRDEYEEKMFAAAYKTGKPILGICRGMQVINVFLGGSLHQHVDGHKQAESRDARTHTVELCESGVLRKILGESAIAVNSFHHQIVKRLAADLICNATSTNDGYIEAFHHKEHPFLLGVQWHPECYFELSETSSKIFDEFIKACGK
jgi:putative glutamine amidotransferase